MQELLDKIHDKLHWVVFLLLEVVSLVLLFKYNSYQGSVWFTKANAAAAWVSEKEQNIFSYLDLAEQNKQLTQENLVLQYNLEQMRQEIAWLKHDTTLTETTLAEQLKGIKFIEAEVVDNSVMQRDNVIVINRGSNDGIKPEQGVICGTGIVGIVSKVGHNYSLVLPVLNSKSRISCRLRKTQYFGSLKWNGGNPLKATVDDIPRHAKVHKGDIIETSGFSKVFPEGLFIGKVIGIGNSEDGMAYQLETQLSVDFARLRDVIVIENVEAKKIKDLKAEEVKKEEKKGEAKAKPAEEKKPEANGSENKPAENKDATNSDKTKEKEEKQ